MDRHEAHAAAEFNAICRISKTNRCHGIQCVAGETFIAVGFAYQHQPGKPGSDALILQDRKANSILQVSIEDVVVENWGAATGLIEDLLERRRRKGLEPHEDL